MTKASSINCLCQTDQQIRSRLHLFEKFSSIRDECPALNQVLIPDKIWKIYKNMPEKGVGAAEHFPMTYMALNRRVLYKLTTPIHQFILKDGGIRLDINPNYLTDLKEDWLIENKKQFRINESRRHERWKEYTGKLVELLCAYWLLQQSWTILKLEAWKSDSNRVFGVPDIMATSPKAKNCAIEVKYVGIENDMFRSFLDHKVRVYSDADTVTFLLCKIYEAAKQLQDYNSYRMLFLVIDNVSWSFRIDNLFNENSVNWKSVSLNQDSEFLKKFKEKHSDIEENLHSTMEKINKVWVMLMTEDFSIEHKYTIPLS